MAVEMTIGFIVGIALLSFFCEYMDATLGMGFGTTLAPVLLIIGFDPLQIVPVVLISELFTGILSGVMHHREGNVDFSPKIISLPDIGIALRKIGYIETMRKHLPSHLKVALLLAACSIVGTVGAVAIAVSIPKIWVKLYIGFLVFAMGVVILICYNKKFSFSWKKIVGLGLLASFNKGISGGGYGPVVTSGQILAGVQGKSAVGITSLAEGLTCAVGIATYLLISKHPLDLRLVTFVMIGSISSVPFSAKSVKRITENRLKLAIAFLTIGLGICTIIDTLR